MIKLRWPHIVPLAALALGSELMAAPASAATSRLSLPASASSAGTIISVGDRLRPAGIACTIHPNRHAQKENRLEILATTHTGNRCLRCDDARSAGHRGLRGVRQPELAARRPIHQSARLLHHQWRDERPGGQSERQLVHADQHRRVQPAGGRSVAGTTVIDFYYALDGSSYTLSYGTGPSRPAGAMGPGPSGLYRNQPRKATRWTRKATWTSPYRLAFRRTLRSTSRCRPTTAPPRKPNPCPSRSKPPASVTTEPAPG